MSAIKPWASCLKLHVIKAEFDEDKFNSLIEMSQFRFDSLSSLNDENSFILVEQYYEIIKELLIALLLLNGHKSINHVCLISYLHDYFDEFESDSYLILTLKNLRNKIQYDGELPEKSFLVENIETLNSLFFRLKELVLEEFNKS